MLRLALKNFWATNAFEPPRGVAWITPIRTQDYKVRTWSDRTDTNLLLFLGSSFEESSVNVFSCFYRHFVREQKRRSLDRAASAFYLLF